MKKGLILSVIVGAIVLSSAYQIFASDAAKNGEGFYEYLIPDKMSTMFFKDKVTFMLSTKADVPQKVDDKTGWMVGIDIDSNQNTGGKWPKVGADYILSIINQGGKWNASLKNVKTGASKNINGEVMAEKNKVDFSVPLSELEMKTAFNWQLAAVSGDNRKALPDLIKATKEGQKEDENYDQAMKNM
jgi:hypothetical protein